MHEQPICLDPLYSTTRILYRKESASGANGDGLIGSAAHAGGLRTRGFVKHSLPGMPLISIVTVVRNAASTLERAVTSVLSQSYDNVEYIIVDGNSTDGTREIIDRYDHCLDLWISEPDGGLYDAMNKGARLASGDWIYFLNADDELLDSLRELAAAMKDPCTVYYGDVRWGAGGRIYDGAFTPLKLMFKNICHQSLFYPGRVFEKYRYDLGYPVLADYHLNIRCFNDPDFRFEYLPVVVAAFNDETGFSKSNTDTRFESEKNDLLKRFFPWHTYRLYRIRKGVVDFFESLGIKKRIIRLLEILGLKRYTVY